MKSRHYLWSVISFLISFFWANIASAQSVTGLSLTPPDSDLSVGYLSNIFGVVDGVLSGTGSQLLGAMFGIFNGAVLVLGGIVIIYTLFVSTLNTAQEGEVLGKRWSSMWIPLRSVIGIALLIPKASGYSFIQIFMMWVAVMGVGAADSIWNRSLDYFLGGGVLIQQNTTLNSNANSSVGGSDAILTGSASLLRSLTCMNMLQKQLESYRQSQIDAKSTNVYSPIPNFYSNVTGLFRSLNSVGGGTVSFPYSPPLPAGSNATNFSALNGVCGSVSWTNTLENSKGNVVSTSGMPSNVANQLNNSRGIAVQSMVSQLNGAAQSITNNAISAKPIELGHILNSGQKPPIWGGGSLTLPANYLLPGNILAMATNTYLGLMGPALNYAQNASSLQSLAEQWITNAKKDGWIMAGRYYYDVIGLNTRMFISEKNPPSFDAKPLANISTSEAKNWFQYGNYLANIDTLVNVNTSNYTVGSTSPYITDSQTYARSLTYGNVGIVFTPADTGKSGQAFIDNGVALMSGGIFSIIQGFVQLGEAQQTNANPIVSLGILGSGVVSITTYIFIGLAIAAAVAVGIIGAAWGFTFSSAVLAVIMILMSIFGPVLMVLLVTGLTMAYYIPIIPFIIFTFGAIGWLISVIECIIAAPLVALGIAHPEGQEILGKAEPAVILLVNVFLRPTFMIFGLLIGMMLSYVGVWILNAGFGPAYASASAAAVVGLAWIFFPIFIMVIYTVLVMQVVQKSFTLIHVIPDEVLKWIGGNIKGMGGEAEAEQKVSGGARTAAETGGQAISKAPDAGKAKAEDASKREDSDFVSLQKEKQSGSSASGQAGGQGSTGAGGGGSTSGGTSGGSVGGAGGASSSGGGSEGGSGGSSSGMGSSSGSGSSSSSSSSSSIESED